MAFSYTCGRTFEQVCHTFSISAERAARIKHILLNEGYTETGICYAANRAEEKLYRFMRDPRFENIFINEVRKYALKPNDPRWSNRNN